MADEHKRCDATNLGDMLEEAVRALTNAGIAEARSKCEWLLAHHVNCPRLELALRAREPLAEDRRAQFLGDLARLCSGEPLQYVLGSAPFRDFELSVDYRALIPRPETEELVEIILTHESWNAASAPVIVDVGTGTGCIAIALARARPDATVWAVDISGEALSLARKNAERLGVPDRITFLRGDLTLDIPTAIADLVVANLPYVRSAEWASLPREIRDYEPRDALDGGKDGLALISRLVPDAMRVLKSGGWLFLETGEDQGGSVKNMMREVGFEWVETRSDLSGRHRFVLGKRP